jgi:hypothetical protein
MFDQDSADDQYIRKHPLTDTTPGFQPLDRQQYIRQTMFVVKQELRDIEHANHVCMVVTVFVHSNHTGYYPHGAHYMWEDLCRMHTYTLTFKRFQIQQWLQERNINVTHEHMNDHDTVVHTNQLGVMVDRCKRFCERYRVATENDSNVKNDYEGKFLNLCEKYCFSETISHLVHRVL